MLTKIISALEKIKEPKAEEKMLRLVLETINNARAHNQHNQKQEAEEDLKLATEGIIAVIEQYQIEGEEFQDILSNTINLLSRFTTQGNKDKI